MIIDTESKELLIRAISKYGEIPQCIVAMEELSELSKEIAKLTRAHDPVEFEIRKRNIVEEIADVYIMIEQLKIMLDIRDDDIQQHILNKLLNLKVRLDGD